MGPPALDSDRATRLEAELFSLFSYVQRVRQEVAGLFSANADGNAISTMSEQLAAIVEATEQATDRIMESAEQTNEALDKLREEVGPNGAEHMNTIAVAIVDVFEACTFQDITGQRVTKVLKSIGFVEEHVNRLANIWGIDALRDEPGPEGREMTADEKLLEGPQLEGKGVSQAEIDALFD